MVRRRARDHAGRSTSGMKIAVPTRAGLPPMRSAGIRLKTVFSLQNRWFKSPTGRRKRVISATKCSSWTLFFWALAIESFSLPPVQRECSDANDERYSGLAFSRGQRGSEALPSNSLSREQDYAVRGGRHGQLRVLSGRCGDLINSW